MAVKNTNISYDGQICTDSGNFSLDLKQLSYVTVCGAS